MINIIKSLNYSGRRDTVNWITIITMLILPFLGMYLAGMLEGGHIVDMTSSAYFASNMMGTMYVFMCYGIMILACRLVSGDASDKTINYEFLAGHSRDKIYFGRVIVGFIWGAVIVYVIMMLPMGYFYLFNGWGLETNMSEVLFRCVLTLFPIIRFTAFTIMIALIVRSSGKGIAINYAVYMVTAFVTSIIQDIFNIDFVYPLSLTNAAYLLVYSNSKNIVLNGKTVTIYDFSTTGEMVWKTITVSLVLSMVYLTISYISFKKTDRD